MSETHKSSCSISGCCEPHVARGYCNAHYRRFVKHGNPLGGRTPRGELLRFINEVVLRHFGEDCLAWPFSKGGTGYGLIKIDGKMVGAHRYVCELAHGEPPTPEHHAAHSCGRGHEGCIAPEHLSWKTPAQNHADKLIHGTHNRGERQGQSKLTEGAVREILAKKGFESQRKLAKRFDVAQSTIAYIHTGRNWAWLSEGAAR
ncbi:hypothetical protein ELG76_04010 [Rhizobium leguminosarum]|uniref:hypothetical protein n=1 Tax=Rhizobium leguminosarum TaxID=384 RepID=UPI00103149AF|nr:hypothetical protein [Rhizobium leguminosarum]TBG78586.1 hypothetical protein ELG76_04010 [Rhizobium leguminosarum]